MAGESGQAWQVGHARSAIDGMGVFAREDIPAGVLVLECRGIVLHRDEVTDDMRAMQIGPDTYLAENPARPSVDDFLNHGCEPNIGFSTGSIALYSLRQIENGEELLFDYSTCMNERGWIMRCRCGALNCRSRVRSYCDMPPRDRRRIERIALSYLRGR